VVCNVTQRQKYRATSTEVLSVAGAVLSLALEHLADVQKAAWHKAHSERPGRGDAEPPVCSTGLWAWCRHPNLFFDLSFQWFVYLIVRPVEEPLVLLFPITLTMLVLLFPGGVAWQELRRSDVYGLYPAYGRYKATTPVFFPWPPFFRPREEPLRMISALP
jgi:steroid 5-alpha reductase family enzyme